MDPQQWDEFVAGLPGLPGDLDREISASVCGGQSRPAAEQIDSVVADFR